MSIPSIKCEKFFITSQAGDPTRPGRFTGDPCLTLREFIFNVHQLYTSNPNRDPNTIIQEIQPGIHYPFSSFILDINIDTLIIRGSTNSSIDCNFSQILRITNIQSVFISDLRFTSCQQYISIGSVNELMIVNSTFRLQLLLSNIKVAEVKKTSFVDVIATSIISQYYLHCN